jgi:hypothetical protein
MQVFVKHNLSSGTANESILRDFLLKHAPGEICVGQGFICDPFGDTENNLASKQCDILIYDQNNYPLVYSDGPIKVVLPGSVRMTIEVKTQFGKKDLVSALENVQSTQQLSPHAAAVIFAFQSPQLKTVINNLRKCATATAAPTAILLFDKGIIIHNYSWLRFRESLATSTIISPFDTSGQHPYAVRRSDTGTDNDKRGFVVTFLLLLFFHAVRAQGLIEAVPIRSILATMEEHTVLVAADVHIGQSADAPR